MKRLLIALVSLALITSCEKVVNPDIDQSTPQIVIEGLLTNKDTTHFVKVSRSIQFYESGVNPIKDATVVVRHGTDTYSYTHNPMAVDSLDGYYFSDTPYAGAIGEAYTLSVNTGGITYEATDSMKYVTNIDSLAVVLAPNVDDEDREAGRIYQVLLFAKEPKETVDFYQFQFFSNDTLITSAESIYVFSDEILGDRLDGLPSPVLFKEGEKAGVEIYSLTKEQYLFYTDLSNLLNSDGGMFSPPPANPRNTFTNNALGLWQVSAVREGSILIEP
ncbi:MAG: DUF4249 domain-containing protein [Cyclobacteriaceae bacterium]|nr:DUF4249 domain-containing protein [Cyclobacteriaceae bacterium]